jgi:hypothetical protein
LLFLFSLSILTLVYGFLDYRSQLLSSYSSQIAAWDSIRGSFSTLKISVTDHVNSNVAMLVQQEQDPEMLKQDKYGPVQTYSPLLYSIGLHNTRHYNESDVLQFSISVSDGNETVNISLPSIPAVKTSEVSVLRGGCNSLSGHYVGFAQCRLVWVRFM